MEYNQLMFALKHGRSYTHTNEAGETQQVLEAPNKYMRKAAAIIEGLLAELQAAQQNVKNMQELLAKYPTTEEEAKDAERICQD